MQAADPILDPIVARLVPAFRPCSIWLFGSRARGEAGPHSDVDILLVLERIERPRWRLSQEASLALRGVPAAVDVVVWSREDFERRLPSVASPPATVAREGRLLHAA